MHELPLIEQVLRLALESAPAGEQIITVKLRVGTLCDAESRWLQRYFRLASQGTAAEKAELEITREEAAVHCPACGQDSLLLLPLTGPLACSFCACDQVTVTAGLEYKLESIEVAPAASMAGGGYEACGKGA
jgi:hydrogenase nickel incorporation protein HypA/HybF